jgi:hypothetical protein
LKRVIDRHVAEGRVASAAEFFAAPFPKYPESPDYDVTRSSRSPNEGIAAGRFDSISGSEGIERLSNEPRAGRHEPVDPMGSATG